jgi:hypothetical protein
MCKCNPNIRTPYCGKCECVWPDRKKEKPMFKKGKSKQVDVEIIKLTKENLELLSIEGVHIKKKEEFCSFGYKHTYYTFVDPSVNTNRFKREPEENDYLVLDSRYNSGSACLSEEIVKDRYDLEGGF